MNIAIHYYDGNWHTIKARKNGRQNKLFTEEAALAEAAKLMQQGASYVELVQHEPRRMFRQLGTIPPES